MGNISRDIAEALADFGLEPGASTEQVKRRYLQLAAKWHPDKHPGDRIAEQAMMRVNLAREVLTKHGTVPEAVPSSDVADAPPVVHPVGYHEARQNQTSASQFPLSIQRQPSQFPVQAQRPPSQFPVAGRERNTVYEIVQFAEHWIQSAMRAGSSVADLPLGWISYVIPHVEARWGIRLCATYRCFSRAMVEDLCNEHQRPAAEAQCKAQDGHGMPCCGNRALPGNNGFCGWHS